MPNQVDSLPPDELEATPAVLRTGSPSNPGNPGNAQGQSESC